MNLCCASLGSFRCSVWVFISSSAYRYGGEPRAIACKVPPLVLTDRHLADSPVVHYRPFKPCPASTANSEKSHTPARPVLLRHLPFTETQQVCRGERGCAPPDVRRGLAPRAVPHRVRRGGHALPPEGSGKQRGAAQGGVHHAGASGRGGRSGTGAFVSFAGWLDARTCLGDLLGFGGGGGGRSGRVQLVSL